MEAPDFWDNAEESQKKMKELKSLKDDMETYQNLVSQMEDMETMIEMGYEENDPDLIPEIQEMLDQFKTDFDNIRVKTLLSGEYDSENAIIKLNAGAGGTEACDWCGMLYRMYSRWVEHKGFSMEVLDYLDGEEAGVKSVTFQVNGENAYGYLKSEKGVHRLVRISPFNAPRQAADVLRILRRNAGYQEGSGCGDQRRGHQDRHLPKQRRRRTAHQQDVLRHPYHPFPHRDRGTVPE